jgi:hypothetical protein
MLVSDCYEKYNSALTNAIDEYTWQNEVVNVEHGAPPELDDVRDVRVGLRTARVEFYMSHCIEADQIELAVSLVVGDVTVLCLLYQVQLRTSQLL